MTDALNFIAPAAVIVPLRDGRAISLEPIRMRQVGPLARAIDAIWPQLMLATLAADGTPRQPQMQDMLGLIAAHAEEMIDAVAICVTPLQLKHEEIQALHPDDFALLALGCLEVNADFFARAVSRLKAAAPSIAPQSLAKMQSAMNTSPSPEPSSATNAQSSQEISQPSPAQPQSTSTVTTPAPSTA